MRINRTAKPDDGLGIGIFAASKVKLTVYTVFALYF